MEPHRAELRRQAPAACDANEGTRAVALRFKVSESCVRLIKQQRRETRQVAPKTAAPRQPQWHAWAGWLLSKIAARPDIYLRELQAELLAERIADCLPADDLQCVPGFGADSKKDSNCPGAGSS